MPSRFHDVLHRVTIDLTPATACVRLREGSYTPFSFTFPDDDFTGYTDPTFELGRAGQDNIEAPATLETATSIQVVFDTTVWAAIGTRNLWQLKITDPEGNVEILAGGDLEIESSL